MTNTSTIDTEQKIWPVWLMASLAFITILCGIVTICAPSIFWKFMDIILGIFLVLSGISWMINAFKNEEKHVGCLIALGIFVIILGILLICSSSKLIGTLTIWAFAIWALLRGGILIFYSLTNKDTQKFRWGILTLGILLIILFFVIAFSSKEDARNVAGIYIGISTVIDGICLLVLSFRASNNSVLQEKILEQANQNEIAQGNVITENSISETQSDSTASQPNTNIPTENSQPNSEIQLGATQQPTPEVQQPNNENPA